MLPVYRATSTPSISSLRRDDTRRRSQDVVKVHNRNRKRLLHALSRLIVSIPAVDSKVIRPVLENLNRPTVHRSSRSSMQLPLIRISTALVGEHLRAVRVRDEDRAVLASQRAPSNIRGSVRGRLVIDDERDIRVVAEGERGVGQDVVDGVVDAVGGGVADGGFVDEDPFVDWGDVLDVGHSRAGLVEGQGDVVDDGAPIVEVGGDLVGELLAVGRVTLVGVVGDYLAFVLTVAIVSIHA